MPSSVCLNPLGSAFLFFAPFCILSFAAKSKSALKIHTRSKPLHYLNPRCFHI